MTRPVHQQGTTANTAGARTAVVRVLQEGGSPAQLDVSGQDLRGITLINGHLEGANLSHARLCEANLCGARLSKADLHGADLRGTYLCWADLRRADLSEADLREACLIWADLQEADLRGALLDQTDLRGADLSWAALGGASTFEQTRSQLRSRGALFRETTTVLVAERFSEQLGRYALGCALGLPGMSVVGFLMGLGVRFIFTQMRLKRQPVEQGDATRRGGV